MVGITKEFRSAKDVYPQGRIDCRPSSPKDSNGSWFDPSAVGASLLLPSLGARKPAMRPNLETSEITTFVDPGGRMRPKCALCGKWRTTAKLLEIKQRIPQAIRAEIVLPR